LADNGQPALCDNIPPFPTCCQKNAHCGWDCDEVSAPSGGSSGKRPIDEVPSAPEKEKFESTGNFRADGRCGAEFPLDDGTPAECDPNSEYWCCSEHGFCGGTREHCHCDTCHNFRTGLSSIQVVGKVRSDVRCGDGFPLDDGSASECDGTSQYPCCSNHGYCGPGAEHCSCAGCVDYRSGTAVVTPLFKGRTRADRRCGPDFPLPDGEPSECDPVSENPCCSNWGFCGPGADHCSCPKCRDYRPKDLIAAQDFNGRIRTDRRCGNDFLIPGTSDPSECDPDSANFCCSKWGFCGGDEEHCNCPECVNYKD